MSTALHKDLELAEIHQPYSWEYADAAARTGASGFSANDVGKFSRQTDEDSIWMLTATTPTWTQVNGAGGPHAVTHGEGGSDPLKLDDVAEPDDNTDLNATASAHGLLPKLSGDSDDSLRGDGTWGAVATTSPIDLTFSKDKNKPFQCVDTDTWKVMARFIFGGTTELGTPTAVKALYALKNSDPVSMDLRLVRADTSAEICSANTTSEDLDTIRDLGTLTGWPTSATVIQIQGKIEDEDTGHRGRLAALRVEF